METKPWYASTVIWAAIIGAIGNIIKEVVGIYNNVSANPTAFDITQYLTPENVATAASILVFILVIVFRVKTTKVISNKPAPKGEPI